MNCRCCNGEAQKFGSFKNVNRIVQRYRCTRCNTTFSESQPLDGMRVDFQKACQVVHLLCEGMGIRAISRITGLDTKTIMSILQLAGEKAASFLDYHIRNVKAGLVQVDELVSFVGIKQANAPDDSDEFGQFFTYLSVDRASKLIINTHTSKRTKADTEGFLHSLKRRVQVPFQLTTDGWIGYAGYNGMVSRPLKKSGA